MSDNTAAGPAILYEELGEGIIQIRLNRPDRLNALGVDMVKDLMAAVQKAIALPARVLLIRGSGRAFCAGADLKERRGMDDAAKVAHNRAINAAVDALDAAPMPTIAVLNGLALGGGCEIAVAAARRVAHMESYVGLVEVGVGLIPGGGGLTYIARRAAEKAALTGAADLLPGLKDAFQAAAMATVGTSAIESRKLGYLLGEIGRAHV